MANTPKVVYREALKEFRKRNDQRYVLEGEYSPNTRVGESDVAENLAPYSEQSGSNDATPFVFQSSGGSKDIGSLAYLKALRGNTVVWNQIINDNFDNAGYWSKNRLTMTVNSHIAHFVANSNAYNSVSFFKYFVAGTLIKNHKYLMVVKTKVNSGNLKRITLGSQGQQLLASITNPELNKWYELSSIFTQPRENDQSTNGFNVAYEYNSVDDIVVDSDNFDAKEPQLFDLTLMFGAGNEPTTVEEFNRLFPKPYYEYNAGELLSCKVNGYKTVGYNAFDGELEIGGFYAQGTIDSSYKKGIVSQDYISVIPNMSYSFEVETYTLYSRYCVCEYDANKEFIVRTFKNKTSSNEFTLTSQTKYVRLAVYDNPNDMTELPSVRFCLHLTWDGTRTGYKPYETKTYPMPNVELKSAGSAYDELKPDGTLIRRIGSYTFTGNETWNAGTGGYGWALFSFVQNNGALPNSSNNLVPTIKSALYPVVKPNDITNQVVDKAISYNASGLLLVRDTSIASASDMAAAMAGKTILFELAEPTEEVVTGYQEITPIDDWGTQEFLYDDTIDIPVPQGNEFFYPVDYKAFIDSVGGREDVEYDAGQLVSLTQLNNFLKTIAGYDATKTQSLKNVSGTIQWVDEE